jgi:hypothetical protein
LNLYEVAALVLLGQGPTYFNKSLFLKAVAGFKNPAYQA